ncbi:MAG: SPOR domain-containing protein [Burkholderiaceae bacterium]
MNSPTNASGSSSVSSGSRPGGRNRPASRGGLGLVPFAVGVAVGCLLSAVLALYITQAPLPLVDKGLRKSAPATTVSEPVAEQERASERPVEPEPQQVPKAEVLPSATPSKSDKPVEPLGTRYVLQVAAFRSAAEADQMKARLAILGFEASISRAQREGSEVFRVRVGPFDQFEALNQMKAALSDNGVESTVVRVLNE